MSERTNTPECEIAMPIRGQNILADRIKMRLEALGITAYDASMAAGLHRTFLADVISGKNKSPSLRKIQAIAEVLRTRLTYLTGEADTPNIPDERELAPPAKIIATAEAGAFRKMPLHSVEREDELPSVDGPRNSRYPNARRFAVNVRGDSMNAAKGGPILDGMIAICVDMEDAELLVETGNMYVVRRTLDHGQTYEFTIKRAVVFKDRVELRPESTNPNHETFVVPRDFDADPAHEIKAIGLVYFSGTIYP